MPPAADAAAEPTATIVPDGEAGAEGPDATQDVGLVATVDDVRACSFSAWYPQFAKATIPSRVISLPPSFVEYLQDDGPLVLPDTANPTNATFRNEDSDNSDSEQWAERPDDAAASAPAPSFPDLEAKIQKAIDKLGGTVFPKLNWSSPRDVPWIMTTGTLKCTTPGDVFLLLKSSEFVTHDLTMPYDYCTDADGAPAEVEYELVLRKWTDVATAMEFRCFVRKGCLVGISQRDHTNFYPTISGAKEAIMADIVSFFNDRVRGSFPRDNYVFDVYRKSEGSVQLVDFNPLSPVTDGLLFEWGELLPARTPDEGTDSAEAANIDSKDMPAAADRGDFGAASPDPPPQERPTLTDKLNKSLLMSFLDRINDPSSKIRTYDSDDEVWAEETAEDRANDAAAYELLAAVACARGGAPAPTEGESAVGGARPADPEVDFRFVQSRDQVRMRPSVYIDSRVPRDILEVKSAEDIERLATLYRRRGLGQDDSDSDDDVGEAGK